MNKLQLALAARDKEYVRRLAGYVRESPFGDRWQLTAFTSANSCKHYLKQGYGIDILVAEPELAEELRDCVPHAPVVVLADRLGPGGDRELLRYQPLPQFMGALEDFCRADSRASENAADRTAGFARPSKVAETGGSTVLSIHSAAGGIGKTTVALHAAAGAAIAGLRACYVNLERFASACEWQEAERNRSSAGLSELLYRVKTGAPSNAEQLASCCMYSALLKCDYIPGFANPEDRLTLSGEDAVAMADFIAATGRYDLIVLDLDNEWTAMQQALLERSDLVYEIVRNERDVIGKQQEAMRYARQAHGERYGKVLAMTRMICNGGYAGIDGRVFMNETGIRESPTWLPEVPEWRARGMTPLSSSPYLAAVCELVKQSLKQGGQARAAG